ncbi:hypothetical protein Tco_0539620 [Tanacetum coccineum]
MDNLAADHLSRLESPHQGDLEKKEINETFPLETHGMISFHDDSSTPWFADIANYHAGNFIVWEEGAHYTAKGKNWYCWLILLALSMKVSAAAYPDLWIVVLRIGKLQGIGEFSVQMESGKEFSTHHASQEFKNNLSDNEESLGEDASKQGRIDDVDAEVTFIDETSNSKNNKNNKNNKISNNN